MAHILNNRTRCSGPIFCYTEKIKHLNLPCTRFNSAQLYFHLNFNVLYGLKFSPVVVTLDSILKIEFVQAHCETRMNRVIFTKER